MLSSYAEPRFLSQNQHHADRYVSKNVPEDLLTCLQGSPKSNLSLFLDYLENWGSELLQNSPPINSLHGIISEEKRILKYILYQLRYFWNFSTALYTRINVSTAGSVPVLSSSKTMRRPLPRLIYEGLFWSTHSISSNLKCNMPVSKRLGNLQ